MWMVSVHYEIGKGEHKPRRMCYYLFIFGCFANCKLKHLIIIQRATNKLRNHSYLFIFLCQLKGRRTSHLSQDKDGHSHDPLLLQVVRKGHRRKAGASTGSARLMAITDCVDNSTQTDISFQNFLGASRGSYNGCSSPKPPPSPPLPPMVESYLLNDL